jgi:hypothetical protein
MTHDECPNMAKCPIFARFHMQTTTDSIILLYCKSDYQKCERKKLKDAGQTVPENLMPSGKTI